MLLHQKVCDTLGISRVDLAEKLGVSKATLDSWSDENRMSKMAKFALELMLENNQKSKLIDRFVENIDGFRQLSSYSAEENLESDKGKLVKRIRHVLSEYNLNVIEAAKRLNEHSFDYLDKVLNFNITPSFDFLNKFSDTFHISSDWLLNGSKSAFDIPFLNIISLTKLSEEFHIFNQIYIVCCDNNERHTRVVVEDRLGRYDFYHNSFCIGHNFIMSGIERSDLYDLYEFNRRHKYSIKLISLSEDEYNALISKMYYARNILHRGKHSYMLEDLFDLQYFNQERYGSFFVDFTNIIKSEKAYREKREHGQKV
ncbi:transcriptional regulator (plasmid) [Campylobacter fetus]|uniref:Transcriptional regulator n=1 Tax=Campylobacter fetus TaxID=196 RepID=A0A974MV37_CAMFE|nr:helix-turn-helix domain-containing protein [Campylobacter fetus]OCS32877.1 hypothetical protein AWR31_08020 [Campylobacter fetus subsp. venerealis]QMS59879.1 transcriptional regulator [Campylobacter fetus]